MAGKLGCIIPVLDQSKHLMARRYIRRLADGSLPPLPKTPYGREKLIPAGKWGMLLNDQVGDCVIAGIYHQIANEITAGTGIVVEATDAQAKQMYMKIAGWDGKLPPDSTDAGTDPTVAYDYWMKTGFPMPDGSLHKIMFYLVIPMAEQWDDQTMGDIQYCLAYFGGGGYCFSVPSSAMTQFDAGQPWTVVASDGGTLGGHYVYQVEQVDSDDEDCITWATAQKMTQEFLKYYGECLLFPVTQDMLNSKGLSPEGLNWVQIVADYGIIKGGGVLPPAPATPTVTSISPATGPATGGTTVTITGSGFTGASQVLFGGVAATFTVEDDTGISAIAPAGSGMVSMVVYVGGVGSNAEPFIYTATPTPTGTTIVLTVGDVANLAVVGGNQTCLVNGVAKPLDAISFLADNAGRVYLGLRDVIDLLAPLLPTGSTISWNETLKQVTIFVPA